MNVLFTSVGNFLTLESEAFLTEMKRLCHAVEAMPMERVTSYLRFDRASSLALIDVIVCMADIGMYFQEPQFPMADDPLAKAMELAKDVRELPEPCTMRDGRKWRSIPFVIICDSWNFAKRSLGTIQSIANIYPSMEPSDFVVVLQGLVDGYYDRVLADYRSCGMLVRFEKGRAQIAPALKLKNTRFESDYYHAAGDLRTHKGWVTVKRDGEGLREDVELFRMLLDRKAGEREMHQFFEQHPAILMEARMGIPISHRPRFMNPIANTPDYAFSPILGPWKGRPIELMELKGPDASVLYESLHPGFSAKVTRAVDQVRDYGRYLQDPRNRDAILQGLGYLPSDAKLAVLIGRSPQGTSERETLETRRRELDVEIVTYDEILSIQTKQLSRPSPYIVKFGTPGYLPTKRPKVR